MKKDRRIRGKIETKRKVPIKEKQKEIESTLVMYANEAKTTSERIFLL
jgi:hypothetical protein